MSDMAMFRQQSESLSRTRRQEEKGLTNGSNDVLCTFWWERFFVLQYAIKHLNHRQQLGRVCFLTRLVGECVANH
jgi:hypothetical protein